MTATLALKNHLDLLIFTNRLCSPTINFFFIKKNWIGGISWLHNAEWHPNFAYLLWQEVPTMKYKSIDLYNWIRELAKYLFDLSSWCGIAAIKLVCDMKVEDWRSCLEPVTLTVSSIFTCCTFSGLYFHSWWRYKLVSYKLKFSCSIATLCFCVGMKIQVCYAYLVMRGQVGKLSGIFLLGRGCIFYWSCCRES